jgi:adenosylcobinamide-GDP ribazoletransferase
MKGFLLALQFLSILPVRVRGEVTERDLMGSALFYPLVGLIAGALLVAADWLFSLVLPQGLTNAMVLLVLVLFSGAFHLDGLADTFDAIAVKGDRERRLAVMREGAAGPAGVTAIVFVLGIKFLAFDAISNLTYFEHYFTLLFMPVAGRWAMLAGMLVGRPARTDGLGQVFIGRLGAKRFALATALTALLIAGLVLPAGRYVLIDWYLQVGLGFAAVFVLAALCSRLFNALFGGQTGDTLGATGELSETLFVLWTLLWSRLFLS